VIIGRKLGKYKVVELLGQGGMATVYKGYDEDVERYVAIKVLPPHPGMSDQTVERFRQEVRVIARLQHPHILPIYDYGSEYHGASDADILYLVMAYVDGGSLENRVDRGPMPVKDVDRILKQIASALDYAHRQGIYHRDIKPGNILLDKEGNALLADFGIAKLANDSRNLTGTGIVGTPAYMAPEQARGNKEIDNRVDIYALGGVVYEMLTGKQPYYAETPLQVLLKHINEPVPSLFEHGSGLPIALDGIIGQAMAKSPDDRYATATEFATEFGWVIQDETSLGALRLSDVAAQSAYATKILDPVDTQLAINTQVSGQATPTQTVIMQAAPNPWVLIGGFGLVAVGIIAAAVVAVLILTSQRPDNFIAVPPPNATLLLITPSGEAATATLPPINVPPTEPSFGTISFINTERRGDSLTLRAENLTPPDEGRVYVAWLIGAQETLRIGVLRLNAENGASVAFSDRQGRNIAAWAGGVIITQEDPDAIGELPSDDVRYRATRPTAVSDAIREMFVTSPDGISEDTIGLMGNMNHGGYPTPDIDGALALYDSVIIEAEIAAEHTGLAAAATTIPGLRLHAEHTINILRGTRDNLDGAGEGENPVGVYAMLQRMNVQLNNISSVADAGPDVLLAAESLRVCLQNVENWSDQIVNLEIELIEASSLAAVESQLTLSTETANRLLNGTDLNGNSRIEAFEGECGLASIDDFGMRLALLTLVAVDD
jgi:predicted Ser/Thr protein kinase